MSAAATTTESTATNTDGPVLNLINKRLRALRKKHNRILQMEDSLSQGKPLNKEQEEVFRSKPAVVAQIDELEKLRQPLSVAVSEEISLALHHHQIAVSPTSESKKASDEPEIEPEPKPEPEPDRAVEELLNILYFGLLFDVKSQSDFASTMLRRIHERGCCLTYDYVTDDEEANDLLSEKDLDSISMLSGLLTSRPIDTNLSHKNALHRCVQHAKLWLSNSDQPIDPNSGVSYAGLRERLNKIMSLDYVTATPELKDPAEVAAAAVVSYTSFQVPVSVQLEDSAGQHQEKEEDASNYQEAETGDNQFSTTEELQQDNFEKENNAEDITIQQEQSKPQDDNGEAKDQQYVPRRPYQNQRGGRGNGGGRRGNFNGRGGRGNGRGSVTYQQQNGHNQYDDQPGNYYPRNQSNNRGRGGRGGGHGYNNHGSAVQGGNPSADAGAAS